MIRKPVRHGRYFLVVQSTNRLSEMRQAVNCNGLPQILFPTNLSSGLPSLKLLTSNAEVFRSSDYSETADTAGCGDSRMQTCPESPEVFNLYSGHLLFFADACCSENLGYERPDYATFVARGVKVLAMPILGLGNSSEHVTGQFRNENLYGSHHPQIRRLYRWRH